MAQRNNQQTEGGIKDIDAELAALRRTVATGSRLAILGFAATISALLVLALILGGQEVAPIEAPGLNVPLPPRAAFHVLLGISGVLGWASWAYLRQASKLSWHLEFEMGANPREIMTALIGSSFVSASQFFFKSASFIVVVILSLLILQANYEYWHTSRGVGLLIILAIAFPYIYFSMSLRIKFLDPQTWTSIGWLFSKLLRRLFLQEIAYLSWPVSVPADLAQPDFVLTCVDDLKNSMSQIAELTLIRMFRRYGIWAIIAMYSEEKFVKEYRQVVSRKVDDLMNQHLTDATPEEAATIRQYLCLLAR